MYLELEPIGLGVGKSRREIKMVLILGLDSWAVELGRLAEKQDCLL